MLFAQLLVAYMSLVPVTAYMCNQLVNTNYTKPIIICSTNNPLPHTDSEWSFQDGPMSEPEQTRRLPQGRQVHLRTHRGGEGTLSQSIKGNQTP